jgi:hypothetical protein
LPEPEPPATPSATLEDWVTSSSMITITS